LFLFVCAFVFSLLVCFQMLLVVLRLDSPQRPWSVVCFVFTGVAAGCLFFLSISVLFLFLCSSSFLVPTRVPRGVLWRVLREYGVIGAVRSLYDGCQSLVHIAGSKSDVFPVRVGLHYL